MKKLTLSLIALIFSLNLWAGDNTWLKGDKFLGTNLWYAPLLDSARLNHELDALQGMNINNLRIFIGGEGQNVHPYQVHPSLMLAPGVYDAHSLQRLDALMDELERRNMKAIFYLTNSWEWSGGYGQLLEWAGDGEKVLPENATWLEFIDYETKFYDSPKAQQIYNDHVKFIVNRYKSRPAVAAWQLCNEPRPFSQRNKEKFADWVNNSAKLIKSIDPETPVSIGSEGYIGCEMDMDLWEKVHAIPEIDYCTIHIWPTNWNWARRTNLTEDLDSACSITAQYIHDHAEIAKKLGKKLVISEFGYPRDNMLTQPGTPTDARDKYYQAVIRCAATEPAVAGINFWGWGGEADLDKGDYTCDPAHEAPGLYSVFAADESTINIIKNGLK